jgi:hypothetical protein
LSSFQYEATLVSDFVSTKAQYVIVSVFPFLKVLGVVSDKERAEEIAKGTNAGIINVIAKINGVRYK